MRQSFKGLCVVSEPDLLIWSSLTDDVEEALSIFDEWRKKYPAHTFSVRKVTILVEDEEAL